MTFSVNNSIRLILFTTLCSFLLVISIEAKEPIVSIKEVRLLDLEEAGEKRPVLIEAQVVRSDEYRRGVFIYDGQNGIYVEQDETSDLFETITPGEVIRIRGITTPGAYLPTILADAVTVIGRKPLPPALPLDPGEINSASLDCEWRMIEGRLVDMAISEYLRSITLTLEMHGSLYKIHIPYHPDELEKASKLMFEQVQFNAVAGTIFNEERQYTGRIFFANSADDFKPIGMPQADAQLWDIHELQRANFDQDHIVRTQGTITHGANREVFLRGERASMKAVLLDNVDVSPGDIVELSGVVWSLPIKPSFRAGSILKTGATDAPTPIKLDLDAPLNSRLHDELVSVDVELVDVGESFISTQGRKEQGQVISLLCRADDRLFKAELLVDDDFDRDKLRIGSQLRLVGICQLILDDEVSWGVSAEGFELQLRGEEDIIILKQTTWWTAQHLLWVSMALIAILGVFLIWIILLRRIVNRQTRIISFKIERESILHERQRVARELHDNLDQGLTGTAVQLQSSRKFIDKYINRLLSLVQKSTKLAQNQNAELASQLQKCLNETEADVEKSKKSLMAVQDMLSYCGDESRKAIWDLRSDSLEKMSLAKAIKESLSPLAKEFNGTINVNVQGDVLQFKQAVEHNLLLLAREAATNSVRHSGGSKLGIVLIYSRSDLRLKVEDNGSGFDLDAIAPFGHFGLQGMRERCKQIDANFSAESDSDGTCISIELLNPEILEARH